MATARNLITTALLRINAIQEGEVADGTQAKDALDRLNEIVDGCNSYPLGMMYATTTSSVPLTGAASYTIGPSGNFLGGSRPINSQILGAWVSNASGIDYPLSILNDVEWAGISDKAMTGERPYGIYINGTYPDASVTLHPGGAATGTLNIQYRGPIPFFTLQTVLALPPSYQRFLTWQLCLELSLEYGQEPSPSVMMFAENSRQDIIKNNTQVPDMVLGGRRGIYDINGDTFRSV